MGQKVNTHGIRVGVIKDWDSRWIASKKDFSDNLVEEHNMEARAILRYARISPRKVSIVMDLIRNKPLDLSLIHI